MGKYGQVASSAANLLLAKEVKEPIEAWEIASQQVFPNSKSSRDKSCPRSTFLGLCEDGYVTGIHAGNYTRSKKNKDYAIKAVSLLNDSSTLTERELWESVIDEPDKKYNAQMDVVKTLWDNSLINQEIL